MRIIKNILFPTDFTNYSLDILEYAVFLSRSLRARLHLLHVICAGKSSPTFDELNEFFYIVRDDPESEVTKNALDQVDLLKVHIKSISVWQGVLDYINSSGIDLVLMAAHAPGKENSDFLSSTTYKVLQQSPVPVMVIRVPHSSHHHKSRFEMNLEEIKKELNVKK